MPGPYYNFDPLERTQTIDESFTRVNDNFDMINGAFEAIESDVSNLAGAIQTLDEQSVRIKVFQAVSSTAGQTVFNTPEEYQSGRLIVYSGGLLQINGVHWNETDSTTFTFVEGRELGEVVQAFEYQLGDGDNVPFPIGTISIFTSTENASGTINSTNGSDGNGVFTVTHTILAGSTPTVKISGMVELVPTTEFTWSGNTITILAPHKPIVGETVVVNYSWSN